jgi:tetratricopeptide (TPR) repeat protein
MNMLRKSFLTFALALLAGGLFAQSVADAGAKYNEGNSAYSDKDYATAVTAYSEALDMAKQAGPDAADLQSKIEKQLTSSYLKQGLSIYKKKDYDGALAVLGKGYNFAKEQNDAKSVKKFASVMAQIRSKKGDALRKEGKSDEAFAEYELAIEIKPNCIKSFYGEGMVMKEKGDLEAMMEKFNKVIELGSGNSKTEKTVNAAKANAARTLLAKAAEEFNAQKFEDAGKYIDLAVTYAPFDEGTMNIFNQFADQVKEVPEMTDVMNKAKEALK